MSNSDSGELERIGFNRILLAISGLSVLTFLGDGALGGGVLLSGLSLGIDIRYFFLSLLISAVVFIFFWFALSEKFRGDPYFSNLISWTLTLIFIGFVLLSFLLKSGEIFLILAVPAFNLLLFSLFSFTTRAISKTAMYPQRGMHVAAGSSLGLLLSAIAISLGNQSEGSSPYIIIGVTLAFAILPFWLVLIGWLPLKNKGIRYIGDSEKSVKRLASKSFWFAIISSSLFLIGSGVAHSVLLMEVSDIGETNRAIAYLFTIPLIFILTAISDKVGRYALLIGAVSMNSVSQILAYSNSHAQLVSAFEISGYYLALVFTMLKISEELTPRNWKLYGLAWGVIFAADFIGALISTYLNFPPLASTLFSLTMMVVSVIVIFFTPKYLESDLQIRGILVLEDNKVVKNEGVNMEEIADLLPKESISEGAAHIELETGQKLVMQKHGKYTTAALVNLHSIDMVKKLQNFANEISKIEGTEDITSLLISDIFGKIGDDEGSDVKFMEM